MFKIRHFIIIVLIFMVCGCSFGKKQRIEIQTKDKGNNFDIYSSYEIYDSFTYLKYEYDKNGLTSSLVFEDKNGNIINELNDLYEYKLEKGYTIRKDIGHRIDIKEISDKCSYLSVYIEMHVIIDDDDNLNDTEIYETIKENVSEYNGTKIKFCKQ